MLRQISSFLLSTAASLRKPLNQIVQFTIRVFWLLEQPALALLDRLSEFAPYLIVQRFLLFPLFGKPQRPVVEQTSVTRLESTWFTDSAASTKANARRFLLNVQTPLTRRGHSYYAVEASPLPVAFSVSILMAGICLVSAIRLETTDYVAFVHGGILLVVVSVIHAWLMEIVTEVRWGQHSTKMLASFRAGFLYFITSEAMLFGSFFAAFLSTGASTAVSTHGSFVPRGVAPFFYWRIPLVNTLLLWTSGYSLTYATAKYVKSAMHTRLQVTCLGAFVTLAEYTSTGSDRLVPVSNQQPWLGKTPAGSTNTTELSESGEPLPADPVVVLSTPAAFSEYQYDFSVCDAATVMYYQEMQLYSIDYHLIEQVSQYSAESATLVDSPMADYRNEYMYPSLWAWDMVVRGSVFLFFQAYEYSTSLFTISDSVYGGAFFALTGLHGVHVLLGVLFMAAFVFDYDDRAEYRADGLTTFASATFHRVGWECAAWYWHFVDVVWLYVFIIVYVWGFPTTYDISYAC